MSGYIGRIPVTEAIQTRKSFTATTAQTTFSMAYQPGFIDVYVNGLKMRSGASEDYVASNGTSIVFNSGLTDGHEVDVVTLTSASIVDKMPTQSSSTNGKFLKSNGTIATWETDNTLPTATASVLGGIKVGTNLSIASGVLSSTDTTYSVGDGGLTTNDFTNADHSKLNAIEASATADQTNAEIKAAVEAATDSNTFTDADHSKLNAIEASATADQTNAEIKTAYEANSDTNEFSDAEQTKLAGIETSADVTDTLNVTAAGALMDSELAGLAAVKATTGTFLTADQTKLDGIATSANNYVHPTGAGDKHIPTAGASGQFLKYSSSGTAVWASDNDTVYTHPNHSGEVTSTGDGATVVADNVVDEANLKVSNAPTNGQFLSAQSAASGGLTWAAVDALPSQSGNAGKYLTTDATNASWGTIATVFPFYKADGTSDTITITNGTFPFYKSDGSADNIGVS